MVLVYLIVVELAKQVFYRRSAKAKKLISGVGQ
jgi:hypothetical protein